MVVAYKERRRAITAWVLATIGKLVIPMFILHDEFQLFTHFAKWKLTAFGSIMAFLAIMYFGKHIMKFIKGMRMGFAKGLIITILEIMPVWAPYLIIQVVKDDIPRWDRITMWISLSYAIGAILMRLSEYFSQEAKEKERFMRYGNNN